MAAVTLAYGLIMLYMSEEMFFKAQPSCDEYDDRQDDVVFITGGFSH